MAGLSRAALIVADLEKKIELNEFPEESKLPSIRRMASLHNVSNTTVVEAYERLLATGKIRSKPGTGFFVCKKTNTTSKEKPSEKIAADTHLWVHSNMIDSNLRTIKPGSGFLADSYLPVEPVRSALRSHSRARPATLLDYGQPQGLLALRTLISERMIRFGIAAPADRITLADSAGHALDMICRVMLAPGNVVIVDDPCSFNFFALESLYNIKVVGVPVTHGGRDLDAFEQLIKKYHPTMYICNSVLENPTGVSMSSDVVFRILNLCEAHGITIVEDDVYADLEESPAPRFASLDGIRNVLYIGGFSKTVCGASRCGFIVGSEKRIKELTAFKLQTLFGNSNITAQVVHTVLISGGYRRCINSVRRKLAEDRTEAIQLLTKYGLKIWNVPAAGYFLWAELPHGINSIKLAEDAFKNDIILAPGPIFSVGGGHLSFLRFNVSRTNDGKLEKYLEKFQNDIEAGVYA